MHYRGKGHDYYSESSHFESEEENKEWDEFEICFLNILHKFYCF